VGQGLKVLTVLIAYFPLLLQQVAAAAVVAQGVQEMEILVARAAVAVQMTELVEMELQING
jgi:hypothetical protein